MAYKNFLPSKDGELQTWATVFSNLISTGPADFGVTAPMAAAFSALLDTYSLKLEAATNPSTRTRAAISAKDDAKAPLVTAARELARVINAFPSITNAQRLQLGLTPRSGSFTPVPVPSESPVIKVSSTNDGRILKIRLSGQDTARRGKPAYCSGATILSYVSTTGAPPADISLWRFEGSTTKTIFDLEVPPSVPGGSQIFITGFWWNSKSQSSPAASPVSAFVGGGVNHAAPPMKLAA